MKVPGSLTIKANPKSNICKGYRVPREEGAEAEMRVQVIDDGGELLNGFDLRELLVGESDPGVDL